MVTHSYELTFRLQKSSQSSRKPEPFPKPISAKSFMPPTEYLVVKLVCWTSPCAHNIEKRDNLANRQENYRGIFRTIETSWTNPCLKRVWKRPERSGDVRAGAHFGHPSLRLPRSLVRWGCSCFSFGPARIDCLILYNNRPRSR